MSLYPKYNLTALEFLEGKKKLCKYYSKEGGCRKCPLYSVGWDCQDYCFSEPESAIRVIGAFLAKGLE